MIRRRRGHAGRGEAHATTYGVGDSGDPVPELRRRYRCAMAEMQVSEEPFLEHSEPNEDGSYGYWYQGTYITFSFDDGRSVTARRYTDTPNQASITFSFGGPAEDDAETGQAVRWLRAAGVSTVLVLGGPSGTSRPISEGR